MPAPGRPAPASGRSAADRPVPDAPAGNWVDRLAPPRLKPYLRLARIDRPIGWWLLLLPCWWSAALAGIAAGRPPDGWHCALFLVGAVSMRGAGSTYNDWVDRDLDARVERTRGRPLPSGQVSPGAALLFVGLQCLVGLGVLLQFNPVAIATGFASVAIVLLYPFAKRFTSLPQGVLGAAFAWGGLMGWVAAFGSLAWPPVLLYAAAIAWTIGYDTVYAVQDLEDDAVAGIRSSARLFGSRVRTAVAAFYGIAVALLVSALVGVGAGPLAYGGAALFAVHLARQVGRIDPGNGQLALELFRSNRDAGLILFAGMALDGIVAGWTQGA